MLHSGRSIGCCVVVFCCAVRTSLFTSRNNKLDPPPPDYPGDFPFVATTLIDLGSNHYPRPFSSMSIQAVTSNGEVTSWIPLATVFTPSPGCESVFRLNGPSLVAFDPGYGLDIDTTIKCAPSAVTTWWEQARLGLGGGEHTAVSIQPLTCPYKWTTVATFTTDTSTTQIMCCPSGYSLQGGLPGPVNGDCVSVVSKGMVLTYASTKATATSDWRTATITLTASSSVGAIAVVGYNVKRAVSTTTSSSTAGSPSKYPSSASSHTLLSSAISSTPSPVPDTAPNNGMSTAIKVGIGLGVSLGVVGISALVVAIIMLRRRSKKESEGPEAVTTGAEHQDENKPESSVHYDAQEYSQIMSVYELPGQHPRSPVEIGNDNS